MNFSLTINKSPFCTNFIIYSLNKQKKKKSLELRKCWYSDFNYKFGRLH